MDHYNQIDTKAWENFLNRRTELKERYDEIGKRYNAIVENLTKEWKGRGADAFREDSEKVMSNIIGIQDILSTICDTLSDCRDILGECDTALGDVNRDSIEKMTGNS